MSASKTERLPLYKKVTNQLREQCFASAGEMLPPLRQLSQMLDVNHATVSRALRDLEQEGLVEIVPRKGIFSVPQSKKNTNIEMVVFVSERSNLLDVALRMSKGMQSACRTSSGTSEKISTHRTVLSVPPFPDVDRFVGELKSRGTAGIVCLGFGFFEGELAVQEEEFLAQVAQRIPVALAGSSHPSLRLDCVHGDPREQMQEFLEDCYSKGSRRFEYIGEHDNNLLQLERRACFAQFMEQKGLTWQWNEFKTQDTSELAAHLNALPDFPEVVVATNVRRALTIALEAQRRGLKLPEELHLLCFASLVEHAQPLLPYATVVMMDEPEVGARAVRLLQGVTPSENNGEPVVERVPAYFMSGPLQRVEHPLQPLIT